MGRIVFRGGLVYISCVGVDVWLAECNVCKDGRRLRNWRMPSAFGFVLFWGVEGWWVRSRSMLSFCCLGVSISYMLYVQLFRRGIHGSWVGRSIRMRGMSISLVLCIFDICLYRSALQFLARMEMLCC